VARGLDQLLAEVDASAPNRSKVSDGSIGDAAHQSTVSDHNPHCQGWVVTARDFTHDPVGGFDAHAFAAWLRRRCKGEILLNGQREIRVKYLISLGRIASPGSGFEWRSYSGSNPHDKHVHVSVDCTPEGGYMDSTQPWGWLTRGGPVQVSDVDAQYLTPRVEALAHMLPAVRYGPEAGKEVKLVTAVQRIERVVADLATRPAATVTLTAEDRAAIVADLAVRLGPQFEEAAFTGAQRAEDS
jgi:hypothetical protein